MTTFLDILRAKATDLEAERNTQLTALETILNSQGERYAAATTDEARAAAMSFTPDEATAYTAARSRVDAISAELDGDGTDDFMVSSMLNSVGMGVTYVLYGRGI